MPVRDAKGALVTTYDATGAQWSGGFLCSPSGALVVSQGSGPGTYRDTILATAGLVSYWRLGETSGTTAADEKGGRPGTYQGTFAPAPGLLSRDSNPALSVAGAGRVNMGTGPILMGLPAFSIEAIVKTRQTAFAVLYAERSNGADLLRLTISPAGAVGKLNLSIAGDDGAHIQVAGAVDINDGVAHHVVVTRNGNAVAFYVDGIAAGTGLLTGLGGAFTEPNVNLSLCRDNIGSAVYSGVLDEVAVYNQALSGAQVRAHALAALR